MPTDPQTSAQGAKLIDGRAISEEVRSQVQVQVAANVAAGRRPPGLAVVLVGMDAASQIYVRNKRSACDKAGLHSVAHDLPATTSEAELLALIARLNADPQIDGILVQLPLPNQIRSRAVIEAIDPSKDVDGFHPYNLGRLAQREPTLRPCTPYGVMRMLQHLKLDPKGMDAVVVGASNIVGRPMALELLLAGATPTICHSRTVGLAEHVRRAQLVVAAVGQANMVRGEWIRPGAIVIDVGMNREANGRLAGDVEYAAAAQRASWITPVPGGVGPMTVAMLLNNTLESYQARLGLKT